MAFLVSAATLAAQSTNSSTSNRNSSGSSYDRSSSGTSGSSMDNSSHQSDMSGTGSYNSNSTQSTGSSSDKLSWSDRRFVNKVADGNQDEVQLAQLASQRASNPDVRNFAQQLVNDHTSMGSELQSLASTKNVKLDQDNNQSREYKRLSNKSGQDFDREFVDHMVDEHEKDIKDFEKASTDAKDMELRSFASKHLADLKQHLATAQNLQRSTMATGRNDNSSGRTSHSDMSTSGTSSTNSSTLDATGSNSSSTPTRDTKSSSTDNNSSNPGTSGTSGSSSAGSTR